MDPDGAPRNLDYLSHLARDSARFVEVLAQAPAGTRVPTCPDWDADDLLSHLGQVQWFWGTILGRQLTTNAEVEALLRPKRPDNRDELVALFGRTNRELQQNLAKTSPDTPAWTWSEEQTAGFIGRRQAHEALIHRLDAELTTGQRTAMDADLSTDGVDEVLSFMGSGTQPGGRFIPYDSKTIRIQATDTHRSWLVTLGQLSGTKGERAQDVEPGMQVVAAGGRRSDGSQPAAATMSGAAADLDCLLWHRPTVGQVGRTGDPLTLHLLDEIISRDQS